MLQKVQEAMNGFVLDEFDPEVDNLSEYSVSSGRDIHATPSLRCTGRGKRPSKLPSIFEINLPAVVVQDMKDQSARTRGRGRARILKPTTSNAFQTPIGHGRTCGDQPQNSVPSAPGKTKRCEPIKSPESAPAGTPIEEVLAHANQRFESYGVLKHNPARSQYTLKDKTTENKENDSVKYSQIPPVLSSAPQRYDNPKQSETQNLSAGEDFPALPTLDFKQFRPTKGTSQPDQICGVVKSGLKSIGDTITSSENHVSDAKCEGNSQPAANTEPNSGDRINNETKENLASLWESMTNRNDNNLVAMESSLLDLNSTSKYKRNPSGSSRGSRRHSGSSHGSSHGSRGVQDNIAQDSGWVVRLENLPADVTQSQLEEVITPYGQVLDLKLELRISEGEENLSADVRLADESIAEFLASCLDGAETIFEGTHAPVKCFIK